MEDKFNILPALKSAIAETPKFIAKLCYLWNGDYLPFPYTELAPSEMSTTCNKAASQRKAASIRRVKQGFVQLCLQHYT